MVRDSPPIRRRLMAILLLTSAVVIATTSAAFVGYEVIASRRQMLEQMATLGRVIAANSTAALAFQDEDDAQEVLAALRTEPSIEAAALYDEGGAIFAHYPSTLPRDAFPATLPSDGFRFSGGHLEGVQVVAERPDHRLGTLYVRSDMRAVYARFWTYGTIAAVVMLAGLALAYVLSRILQQRISSPILSLANTARAVFERGDFSVRAPVEGEAEFRLLTNAFNEMLGRIASQQTKLQEQLARLDLLQRTTRAIGERQDLRSIFQVILRNLEDNLPVDFGCVCLYEPSTQALKVASIGTRSAARAKQLGIEVDATLAIDHGEVARWVNGTLVHEPSTDDVRLPLVQRFAAAGLQSLVAAPLVVEDEVFGVLLAARDEAAAFTSTDCEFLRQLSEHVALAAHQVRLYTALQQAYEELRHSQQSMLQQERLRALGQMASGIAHDINNAISPVTLYTESLLEREPGLSERAREYLRIIQRSIDDVGQTVARMREFYRQRDQAAELAPLQLNPLIDQVLELTRARWSDVPQERGVVVDVRKELTHDLPRVMGIESDIRDALTNLIFNAVDAMPAGGTLTLRTRVTAGEPGAAKMPNVDLEISDTGTGMDEETRRRCLEPFFTTKGERGTGMGLAMVYGMVKRHAAQIDIRSELGFGTTVRVRFAAAPAVMPQAHVTVEAPPPARLRLLVIDDDPLVVQSLMHVLHAEGHVVTPADGGQAGIDTFTAAHYTREPFDVVMTDLGMPYVDGRAVASAVKALSPRTPVLLLTGWGQRLATEQSVPPNVDLVLSKPPKIPELRRAFADLVTADKAAANA